jgi:hypothetical protein
MEKIDLNDVLNLMREQKAYIDQVVKFIYTLSTDWNISRNVEFQEFLLHFNLFIQNHSSNMGFSNAMEAIQVYNYVLLEKLLSTEVLSTAEQLELAISHLERIDRKLVEHISIQFLLLIQGINLLEETELKIIESLESVVAKFGQIQLQN